MIEKNTVQTEEMSTVSKYLPRYYKGFDMDVLMAKMWDRKPLTREEENAIDEAQDIYRKKHSEEVEKKEKEWIEKEQHITICIDPGPKKIITHK